MDDDAAGANDGTSWANAYVYLQEALADANQAVEPAEIRVAQGVYPPDRGEGHVPGDRTDTFHLLNSVALKGGYVGLAGDDPNARDIDQYATILTGDLGTDRSYHVVTGDGTDETAVLDGFAIADGNGARSGMRSAGFTSMGAGMTNDAGSPTVTRCTFRHNSASLGAGMYNGNGSCPSLSRCVFFGNDGDGMHNADGSCPTLTQCIFAENEDCGMENDAGSPTLIDCTFAENEGSGMSNHASSPTLVECTFTKNTGRGMFNEVDSSPNLTDCTFNENSAGGMMNSGGSDPLLIDCVFSKNVAGYGGGMLNNINSNPTLTNCTFSENLADSGGGMANQGGSEPDLVECSFIGNVAYSGGAIYCLESGLGRGGPYPPGNLAATHCFFADNLAHGYGGAICGGSECGIAVANCTFTGNVSDGDGGGIYGEGCKATLIECELTQNTARVSGGGIYADDVHGFSRLTLIRSRFCGNRAGTDGGGLSVVSDTRLEATHCLFAGNVASDFGGAIYGASWAEQSLTNCTLAQNVATRGSALHHSEANWIHVANCILWDNIGDMADYTGMPLNYYKYCDAQDLNAYGPGSIHADPLFARSGYWVSRDDPNIVVAPTDPNALWVNGDYHLKSEAGRWDPNSEGWVIDDVTSPCVDAGDPTSPVASERYANGGIINMGFYGGTAEASKSPSDQSAKYGGGAGHPDDPFLIYTAEQMNTIGATRSDWDNVYLSREDETALWRLSSSQNVR
ncbi:MAG: right-handed parallel beta-helix repeat-containing protein [Phycisphaerales bacterium]|nr:MAG: right-handed parallel beta-helix repeat-containing protein [Phycisphaerales bacterium]